MKLGRAHWIFVLVGFTFILSIMSTRLGLNESLAETSQLRGDATSGFDPLKAARQVVNETRKAWKESYEGDPSLAKQKFAQSMKKVDQDFAPVRAAIDKSSEQDQKVFALEYFEQMNTLVREQIIWLENKIDAEADPKLKQEFQRHLKDYKNQYPQWETELQRLKSELR
ncbi:MAG: hypothetical protein ABIQ24_07185 [Nitrospiraceae bacterium]